MGVHGPWSKAVRRVLSLWFPTFATDLIRRKRPDASGKAILLTRQVGARELIAGRCAIAAAAGIAEGMDRAHAHSLLPPGTPVHVQEHRPEREAAALHSLACWALRFSPLVAPDLPDGLAIDTTGTERLHRGENRLIRSAAAAVRRLGFPARIAAASTLACAWGVARYGKHDLAKVPTGREREALAGLPVAGLGIDEATVIGLEEIGITCIGHVLDLPRASVASRFSPLLLLRLDQAMGWAIEHLEPVRPAPPARAAMMFDGPTDRWESVEAAARQVLNELVEELTRRERGVRKLDLELLRPSPSSLERVEIVLSRPSRNVKHLWSLVRSRLERIDMGAGVEGMVFIAVRTARLRHEQASSPSLGADTERATAAAWGELVDTLAVRLGPQNVARIEPVESHIPERAVRERPAIEEPGRQPLASTTSADRPTLLLPRPEPAEVMALTPDGPILSLGWRHQRWRILSCIGPERIGPEWWRWGAGSSDAVTKQRSNGATQNQHSCSVAPSLRHSVAPPDRDYFAVQTETGCWLWVCRQVGAGRWFVQGIWS